MFSTGEVCILPPTPVSDPDAVALAELDMGAILLDLDHMQDQQRQVRFPGPSPSPSGFGYPPSPDMHSVSFYPEHHMAFPPVQQMGGSIPQQGGSEMNDIDNDEMVRLIMREMIPDILADCQKLNLQPNLYLWSAEEVQRWVACIMDRFELGDVELGNFYVNGATLASLQDIDFRERAPKCGDIIASVVCLLKSSMMVEPQPQVVPQIPTMHLAQPHMIPPQHTMAPPAELPPASRYTAAPISPVGVTHRDYESGSTGSPSDDESSIPSPAAPTGPNTSMTPNHTGGIQLWQFLKELLLQPNSYSYCIRWLDRSQGIFKIEDSVEVARLWGLRKNRPAMNYDKLSRSIRQYYRKGIMKKTEVSQRLVYQFVHPC